MIAEMLADDPLQLAPHLRTIVDYPKPGILFQDITPLLQNGPAFARTVAALAQDLSGAVVLGLEARGFIFAAAAAAMAGVPFVPVRKPGKLPHRVIGCDYALEYGTDRLEMHADAVQPGARVVMIDDLLATGGTASAAARLAREAGAARIEARFVIGLRGLPGEAALVAARVPFNVLLWR